VCTSPTWPWACASARYLAQENIARGVSVQYTIEQGRSFGDGEIVRVLPEQRISGSINPDTLRRTNDPTTSMAWRTPATPPAGGGATPNVAVPSVEVAGRAKDGPSDK
jgi:hypothetical protein